MSGPVYRRYLADLLRAAAAQVAVLAPDPAVYGLDPAAVACAHAEFARDLDRQARIIDPPRRTSV